MTALHKILYEFRARDDSRRSKLLRHLAEHSGKQLPYTEVMDAVYGKKKGSKSAFSQLICKLRNAARDRHLPYNIETRKDNRGQTVGFYSIEDDNRALVPAGGTIAALNSKIWG